MNNTSIKASAKVSEAFKYLRPDLQQKEISADIHTSRSLVSHYKRGTRNMTADVASKSIEVFENDEYTTALVSEFTNGATPPLMRGEAIEAHRLALIQHYIIEQEEAIKTIKDNIILLSMPIESLNADQRQNVKTILLEVADGVTMSWNAFIKLTNDYGYTAKKIFKSREKDWKVWKWLRNEVI
ncbi:helix-turn-helix transcriptional regulator [Listeria rocourtiae]|uniref:helix-turn-helix domain-containing protein n=1 Tax=Listeria rocourtiae TaxID=647910 RepID=UPI003D2F5221